MPRYLGIQIAAGLIFACTVMNLTMFFVLIEELLGLKHPVRYHTETGVQKVCVLVPVVDENTWNVTLPSLAESIRNDSGYVFDVYVGDNVSSRADWFERIFPVDSSIYFVPNASTPDALVSVASLDGCTFHFVVDRNTRFLSHGWAETLMRALRGFSPQYVGAVSPVGCDGCVFIHSIHHEIFSRFRLPVDRCWSGWVRSVYGRCRMASVDGMQVVGGVKEACPADEDLVSRGRLFINKFLTLGLGGFRASRRGENLLRVNAE
jgi:hypothetical protein